jgi:hypothetical protein
MLSTDLFIVTPFQRDQIILTESCQEEPLVPFSEYSILVLQSRLEPYFKRFFSNRKYKYDSFGFRDVPHQGKMITTIMIFDSEQNPIQLEQEENRMINLEIAQIVMLHPNYFLFYSEEISNYPQAWLRTVLPVFQFTRTSYYLDEMITQDVPTIYHDGNLYMDLSQDPGYWKTMDKLYSEFVETLSKYYYSGTIPDVMEITSQGVVANYQMPGDFIEFKGKLGDEVLEDMAELTKVKIPESDQVLLPEKRITVSKDRVSKFILNFSEKVYEFDLFMDQIGVEFLVSLKSFFQADQVITKRVTPSYYEIVVVGEDEQIIQSSLDIKEMFGFFYFTDHPLGLLVLDEMGLLNSSKVLYDDVFGKGGIFVPMVHLEDAVQKDILLQDLENKKSWVDVYSFSDEIYAHLKKFGLKILCSINEYLFVQRNSLLTQRVIYRSLIEEHPSMLIGGPWDFEQVSPSMVIELANEICKEMNMEGEIQQGPFSTLVVPVYSIKLNQEWFIRLRERYQLKISSVRMF